MSRRGAEMRAVLVAGPLGDPQAYSRGAANLGRLDVTTSVPHVFWGTAHNIQEAARPVIAEIFGMTGHNKKGPVVLIGTHLGASLVGRLALGNSEVDGAILITPPTGTEQPNKAFSTVPVYGAAVRSLTDAWTEARPEERAKLTLMTSEETDYLPGAERVLFTYPQPEHQSVYNGATYLLTTNEGSELLVANLARFH